MAQLVKHLGLGQVMIPRAWDLALSSLLSSQEPASPAPSVPLPPPTLLILSLSLK